MASHQANTRFNFTDAETEANIGRKRDSRALLLSTMFTAHTCPLILCCGWTVWHGFCSGFPWSLLDRPVPMWPSHLSSACQVLVASSLVAPLRGALGPNLLFPPHPSSFCSGLPSTTDNCWGSQPCWPTSEILRPAGAPCHWSCRKPLDCGPLLHRGLFFLPPSWASSASPNSPNPSHATSDPAGAKV